MTFEEFIDFTKTTILVIDDTPDNLSLLGEILTDAGYKPLLFPSGELALNAVRKKVPDLILLDIMMSDMDGFQVCEKLKSMEALIDIPIIFISALDDINNKVLSFEMGGVDYITKPFHKEEVIARVQTHLELYKSRQALQKHKEHLEELVSERNTDLLHAEKLSSLGKWTIDLKSTEIHCNDITCGIFNIGEGEVLTPESFFKYICKNDYDRIKNSWSYLLATDEDYKLNEEFQIKVDNGCKWIHLIASYQYDKFGKKHKILGTFKDINQKKEQIIQLERQNDSLKKIAWVQSHLYRGPLTRMMYLINLGLENNFEIFSLDDIFNSLKDSSHELDELIKKVNNYTIE